MTDDPFARAFERLVGPDDDEPEPEPTPEPPPPVHVGWGLGVLLAHLRGRRR